MNLTLDLNTFPNGGWIYYEPKTQWNAPRGLSFTLLVQAVYQHRAANPKAQLSTDFDDIKADIIAFTRARLKMPTVTPPPQGFMSQAAAGTPVKTRKACCG